MHTEILNSNSYIWDTNKKWHFISEPIWNPCGWQREYQTYILFNYYLLSYIVLGFSFVLQEEGIVRPRASHMRACTPPLNHVPSPFSGIINVLFPQGYYNSWGKHDLFIFESSTGYDTLLCTYVFSKSVT